MARRAIHNFHPNDNLDRFILIAAFILGAGGSIALKLLEVDAIIAAIYPVVILLSYAFACWASQALSIEPETVGDNCYYLGFLFTLTSLAVTLYQIRGSNGLAVDPSVAGGVKTGGAEDVIPLVISGFGIALSSTIAGVFLRVLLMQLRSDIVSRDREVRLDLARGARDFRDTIASVSRGLKTMAVEATQHAAERNAKIDTITDEQLSKANELMERQATNFDTTLQTFVERLGEEVSQTLDREMRRATKNLLSSSDQLASSLKELSNIQQKETEQLREAHLGFRYASEGFKLAMTESQSALMSGYTKMIDSAGSISAGLSDSMGSVKLGTDNTHKLLDMHESSVNARIKALAASNEEVTKNHSAVLNNYQNLADSADKITGAMSEIMASIQGGVEKTQGHTESYEKAMDTRTKALVGRHDAIDVALGRIEEVLQKHVDAIQKQTDNLKPQPTDTAPSEPILPPTTEPPREVKKPYILGRFFGNG